MATPPGRRKFLTTEEFAATYGAASEDIETIVEFARQHDLAVVESSIPCRTVVLSGTVAQMSRAFAVELGRYRSGDEIYRGRDGFVRVPSNVAGIVLGVLGLDNRRLGSHNSGSDPTGTTQLVGGPP